jgi:hypothetical protein
LSDGFQNQQVVGEPDLDSKDQCLKKQEGLRLSLEKLGVGYVIKESQNFRYPDNEKYFQNYHKFATSDA